MSEHLFAKRRSRPFIAGGALLAVLLSGCEPLGGSATPKPPTESSEFAAKSHVRDITPEEAAKMKGATLRDYPGCAAAPDLAVVEVPYHNFADKNTMGKIVVRRELADDVGKIFEEVHTTGFQIEHIAPAEEVTEKRSNDPNVGVEIDDEMMAKNYTSGFNCRTLNGAADKHGQGRAIDINPFQNPMIEPNPFTTPHAKKYTYSPPEAKDTWDKNPDPKRLLSAKSKVGAQVIAIFKRHGWRWGGDFKTLYDGQHFDKPAA